MKNQSAYIVAKLLVEHVISRHGVPKELLSDQGANFWSGLTSKVMCVRITNTTAYHPQTDGLIKRFNCILISMLAKTVEAGGCDWDESIPYILLHIELVYIILLRSHHPFCSMAEILSCPLIL